MTRKEQAQQKLSQARKERERLYSQMRRAQKKAQKLQTKESQRSFEQIVKQLDKQRERVSHFAERVQFLSQPKIVQNRTNPSTFKNRMHPIKQYRKVEMMRRQGSISPTMDVILARTAYEEVQQRMDELRMTMYENFGHIQPFIVRGETMYPVPEPDSLVRFENRFPDIDFSDPNDRRDILMFANQLFNTNEFSQTTSEEYEDLIETERNSFVGDLVGYTDENGHPLFSVGEDYVVGENQERDNFYSAMNYIRRYFPTEWYDSDVRLEVSRCASSGMNVSEIMNHIDSWIFGEERATQQQEFRKRKEQAYALKKLREEMGKKLKRKH